MFNRSNALIAIVTIVLGISAINSFGQARVTPGEMGCLLGAGHGCTSGGSGNGNGGSTTTGGGNVGGGRIGGGGIGGGATASADLVLQSNGQLYGTAYAFNGSHFELYSRDGSVLKTYANGCKPTTPSNGIPGLMCSMGHFDRNGRLIYSGWALVYQNGFVYLRWMYDFTSGFQQTMDTGWVGLMPKP